MVGKGAEFIHLEDRDETIRRKFGNSESFAESVAGGTIMIGRGDLENAGGWRPVPRSVDLGMITRVKADGGLVYRTHPFGYIYHRRAKGHTWDPGQQYFLDAALVTWPGLPPYAEFGALGHRLGLATSNGPHRDGSAAYVAARPAPAPGHLLTAFALHPYTHHSQGSVMRIWMQSKCRRQGWTGWRRRLRLIRTVNASRATTRVKMPPAQCRPAYSMTMPTPIAGRASSV